MKDYQDKKELKHGTIPSNGVGHCCKKGMKPESPSQDGFVMLQCGSEFGLYGVFDGILGAGQSESDLVDNAYELIQVLNEINSFMVMVYYIFE